MNRIQKISREVESDRLKLQMGLDPSIDIDHQTLRGMWMSLASERLHARQGCPLGSGGIEDLPADPEFPPRS